MTARFVRVGAALLLEVLALALLVSAVSGHPWPVEPARKSVVVLADRSASMPSAALQSAVRDTAAATLALQPAIDLRVIDFAGQTGPARVVESPEAAQTAPSTDLARDATNLARAIEHATLDDNVPRGATLVIVSDGKATIGDTVRALEGAAMAGTAVLWRTVVAPSTSPRIAEVFAPGRAHPGQPIPVTIRFAGTTDRPLRVVVAARDASVPEATSTLRAGELASQTLLLQASSAGTLLLDVRLVDAATNAPVEVWELAAAVNVEPRATVLYVTDQPSALARSLQAGGWTLEPVTPRQFTRLAAQLSQYSTVILDDIPVEAAQPATWDALARAVRDRGTGLLVLGGGRSFAAGSYHGSRLEDVLPVESRPAALGDAAAVAFVVDKSGSMGASAAGVDRFRMAQRAVAATAATLTERDAASLIVFDVAARELIRLTGAARFQREAAAPWPVLPRGGTRLAPAMAMATAQLEGAAAARRILILVTDGFVDEVPVAELRARLALARIELIALAVGPDANLNALAGLAGPSQVTLRTVSEAAELPALMRSSLETRRAPVERGVIAVHTPRALHFVQPRGDAWPPVSAYAVTTPRGDAVVHVESAKGDPLIAYRQEGLGRVVVVTSGLGAWTQDWLRWRHWPALAGGLVDWVAGAAAQPGLALRAADLPMELLVNVDLAAGGRWSERMPAEIQVHLPSGRIDMLPLAASAPGRVTCVLRDPAAGLYRFTVVTTAGSQSLTHLRQPVRERGIAGPNPQLQAWQGTGLIQAWSPAALARAVDSAPTPRVELQRPLLFALLLFVCGVILDRFQGWPGKMDVSTVLRSISRARWSRRDAPGP
jgi:uncharacterized membrane protein